MRKKSHEQRVEELSKKVGGRFKLTALVQKRMREFHMSSRAFMPNVRNLDELFGLVLDEVEGGTIGLRYVEKGAPPPFLTALSSSSSERDAE